MTTETAAPSTPPTDSELKARHRTMWGLGVASGSILAGHYWHSLSGELIFILAGCAVLLGLGFISYLHNEVQA